MIKGPDTKQIREALGLNQTEWAHKLGIAWPGQVSRWENGKSNPTKSLQRKILRFAIKAGVKVENV